MRTSAFLLLLLTGLLGAGCNRYGRRVPDEVLKKLPYESRIELLEAENELALAIDHLDEAKAEVVRTREALRRAKERLAAAKKEVRQADDEISKEVAQLAVAEGESRVEFLRARQRVNSKEESIHELLLRCAHAKFELARLTVARKAKIAGSESLPTEAFENQAKSCDAEVAEDREELKKKQADQKAAKDVWDADKQALAKKTFDARASPYVE